MIWGRQGFSLLIVWILLFSFLAAFPLIFRQIDDGQRRSEAFSQWVRYQMAAESSLQILAKNATSSVPISVANFEYSLSDVSTLTFRLFSQKTSLPNTALTASCSAFAYVIRNNNLYFSGFDDAHFVASYTFQDTNVATSPALYSYWRRN